jgi:predicted ATPase/DNA-binding winged helix-turn-helix (wHTH) protein
MAVGHAKLRRVIRFDDCAVDVAAREVRLHGRVQHLEPRAFDVLAYLLAHRERVVAKEELLDEVWGDRFVSESALTTRIKEVRQAIGDDGTQQRLVRNVRGRGYRFVGQLVADEGRRPPIIGRSADVTAVMELLGSSRLVTLIGPGGVGKTRLAVETAAHFAGRVGNGAAFVDLAAINDPDAIIPAVLHRVGIRADGDPAAALRALGELDALVVLDNCEHLVDAVASLVETVTGEPGRVRILATSRERLGANDEQVWPVTPLDRLAARSLFLQRARVAAGAVSAQLDEASVDQIVDSLDRLPLAIEMAAARMSSTGLDELATIVATRLDLLRSPVRGTTDRHHTLTALIAWSEELLDPDERTAFAELAVFAGPVRMADIDGVLSADDAFDHVCRLVDRSLAVVDATNGPARYRLLETVRRSATVRLDDPEAVERRHANWFTAITEDADQMLRTPAEAEGRTRIEDRRDERRAAHRWATLHAPDVAARLTAAVQLHAHTTLWSEPAEWAHRLSLVIDPHHAAAPHVWGAMANAAAHAGRLTDGLQHAERALAAHDPRAAALALEAIADIAMYQGDLARCGDAARQLADIGRRLDDLHATVLGHVDQALALVYAADHDAALPILHGLTGERLAPSDRAWILYAEGEALAEIDPVRSLEAFDEATDLADNVGNRFLGGVSRVAATSVHARSGEPQRALQAFTAILDEWRRQGNVTHLVIALRNLAELFTRVGALEAAGELLGALQTGTVAAPYGAEAQRLAEATATLERSAGQHNVGRWFARGGHHDLRQATTTALAAIATLTQTPPTRRTGSLPSNGPEDTAKPR